MSSQLLFGNDPTKVVKIKMGAILEYYAILIGRVKFDHSVIHSWM